MSLLLHMWELKWLVGSRNYYGENSSRLALYLRHYQLCLKGLTGFVPAINRVNLPNKGFFYVSKVKKVYMDVPSNISLLMVQFLAAASWAANCTAIFFLKQKLL